MRYLKQAQAGANSGGASGGNTDRDAITASVRRILCDIQKRGKDAVRDYAPV